MVAMADAPAADGGVEIRQRALGVLELGPQGHRENRAVAPRRRTGPCRRSTLRVSPDASSRGRVLQMPGVRSSAGCSVAPGGWTTTSSSTERTVPRCARGLCRDGSATRWRGRGLIFVPRSPAAERDAVHDRRRGLEGHELPAGALEDRDHGRHLRRYAGRPRPRGSRETRRVTGSCDGVREQSVSKWLHEAEPGAPAGP